MSRFKYRAAGSLAAVALSTCLARAEPADRAPMTPAQIRALHALIKPHDKGTGWRSIPWMTDFHAARKKAAAEGKPLFVWAMAGEPLGSA